MRLRLSELIRMRGEYQRQRRPHFVAYLDGLISDLEREIADAEYARTQCGLEADALGRDASET